MKCGNCVLTLLIVGVIVLGEVLAAPQASGTMWIGEPAPSPTLAVVRFPAVDIICFEIDLGVEDRIDYTCMRRDSVVAAINGSTGDGEWVPGCEQMIIQGGPSGEVLYGTPRDRRQ